MWNNFQPPTPLDFSSFSNWEDELFFESANSLATNYTVNDYDIGSSYFPTHLLSQEVGLEVVPHNLISSNISSTGIGFEDLNGITNNNNIFDQEVISMEEIQVKNNTKTTLSREEISKYFYMPITDAVQELNIGLSSLKKRCRELGIKRWPYRKLKSLQTLINNVEAMSKDDNNDMKVKEAIEELAYEQRLMEAKPDLQFKDKTKRLRQACFKGSYNRRKQVIMMCKEEDEAST